MNFRRNSCFEKIKNGKRKRRFSNNIIKRNLLHFKISTWKCLYSSSEFEFFCIYLKIHFSFVKFKEIVVGDDMNRIFIVMDYVEHDLKSLMTHTMKKPFSIGEIKTLMYQLLSGVNHLHDNWIIHRDLKTSNLLLSNRGILKVCFL